MFVTRYGAKLNAHPPRSKKPKRAPLRGIIKPSPFELPVDWLYEELVNCKPVGSIGAYDFKWEYLCSELLSKLPLPLYSNEYRKEAAIAKMLETEKACFKLNLKGYEVGFNCYTAERFNTVANKARDIIYNILGDVDLGLFERSRFSGGASTSRRRVVGDPYYKYKHNLKRPLHVTSSAYPYAVALIQCTPLWREGGVTLEVVPGNRISTVPKKTEIDRTIAMEPDMNMSLQLAVGSFIRGRLRKVGIDLDDQTVNQELAKFGSTSNLLATIDLSSASDSISYHLVRDLLPYDWFALLDDLRSKRGTLPTGEIIHWQKFSSMGNGFTFELETLIFYALSLATIRYEEESCSKTLDRGIFPFSKYLNVYGDDIICPCKYASSVIEVLSIAGFQTNVDKTFVNGPFRESCGKHYHQGIDVTPFFIRKAIDSYQRVIWLLNKLRKWAYDDQISICDPSVWNLWRTIRKRHILKSLTGGKDIDSSESVCSPGNRKSRLMPVNSRKRISGLPVLLRYFQSRNGAPPKTELVQPWWYTRPIDSRFVQYIDLVDILPEVDMEHLVSVQPTLFRLKPNREMWQPIPLFPKEIA